MRFVNFKPMKTGLIALALTLLPLAPARAGDDSSFDRFCAEWMSKLAQRERQNIAKVRWEKRGPSLVGQYTGYARTPIQCKPTTAVTPGRPAVGKLVYQEILYEKAGSTAADAQGSRPAVLQTTEVMEVFRYDGHAWKY